ncbi:MAG TPA: arsinothricin resistance N-acetyltransferase ArsN1 family B [Balneolales bacterium]|nr:arsinothricin resistance N-acetyltransferase ArsN1 family B [Balneolales bacterium]
MAEKLIRLAKPGDAGDIAAIYAPFVRNTATSFELEPPDEEEFRKRLFNTLTKWPWLVCEIDGRIAGYAYAGIYRSRAAYQWAVEVSVYINPEFHRRGVGKALYTSLFAMLARQGFYTAFAGVTQPNEASTHFHRSMGFEYIGVFRLAGFKHGRWRNVSWWSRTLRDDFGDDPKPTLTPAELKDDEGWLAAMQCGGIHIK